MSGFVDSFHASEHPWVTAGREQIRFGIGFVGAELDWEKLSGQTRMAESMGFDAIWVPDHPVLIPDPWTKLAALAVSTERIRLATLVSCVYYRDALLLARVAADVDRLSGGRLVLGVGMGDLPQEFEQMGLPYPAVPDRQRAVAETIEAVRGLWRGEPFSYQGSHVRLSEAFLGSSPIQQPHVPILIAGGGEKVTLRQVAKYADASNFGAHAMTGGAATIEDVRRKCDVLRKYCEQEGRAADSVLRTHITLPLCLGDPASVTKRAEAIPAFVREPLRAAEVLMTVEEAIASFRALVDAGIRYFVAAIWDDDMETLHALAEKVIPAVVG